MNNPADPRRGGARRRSAPRTAGRLARILSLAATTFMVASAVHMLAAQAQPPAAKAPATPTASTQAAPDTTVLERRIIAYYFHTNYRCTSCRQIEAYSHAAIEAAFPEELASGRLVWRLVNVEEKGNEHFVDDYQLFTKALVVVEEAGGKQVRWKNLEKVWELLPRQEKFYVYVQNEVRSYLNQVP